MDISKHRSTDLVTDSTIKVCVIRMPTDSSAIPDSLRSTLEDLTSSLERAQKKGADEPFSIPDLSIGGIDDLSDSDKGENDGPVESLSEAVEAAKKALMSTIGEEGMDFLSDDDDFGVLSSEKNSNEVTYPAASLKKDDGDDSATAAAATAADEDSAAATATATTVDDDNALSADVADGDKGVDKSDKGSDKGDSKGGEEGGDNEGDDDSSYYSDDYGDDYDEDDYDYDYDDDFDDTASVMEELSNLEDIEKDLNMTLIHAEKSRLGSMKKHVVRPPGEGKGRRARARRARERREREALEAGGLPTLGEDSDVVAPFPQSTNRFNGGEHGQMRTSLSLRAGYPRHGGLGPNGSIAPGLGHAMRPPGEGVGRRARARKVRERRDGGVMVDDYAIDANGQVIRPPGEGKGRRARARRARERREKEAELGIAGTYDGAVGMGEAGLGRAAPHSGVYQNTWKDYMQARGVPGGGYGTHQNHMEMFPPMPGIRDNNENKGSNGALGSNAKSMGAGLSPRTAMIGNANGNNNHRLVVKCETNGDVKPASSRAPFDDGMRRVKSPSVGQPSYSASVGRIGGGITPRGGTSLARAAQEVRMTPNDARSSSTPRNFAYRPAPQSFASVAGSASSLSARASYEGGVKRENERMLKEHQEKVERPYS